MTNHNAKTIAFRLTSTELEALDRLVTSGVYQTRTAALRSGLRLVVERARNAAIVEEHRAAYLSLPDDFSIGDLGLAAGADLLSRENIEHRDAS